MNMNGTESSEKLEKALKLCESKGLPEADAQKLVDQLDRSLHEKQLNPSKKRRYFMSLTKICKVYCFVPTSHLIVDAKLQKLGDAPVGGASSNLWPGMYGEQEVSIKVMSRYESEDVTPIRRRLCREAVVWMRIIHPNILPLTGITLSKEIAVVSPWMENGNVLDYLRENHEANPVKLLEESALGLQYLHEVGIVHGDLQGRHILVTDDGHACLANVGHANIVREQGDSVLATVSTTVDNSNLRYLAPEHYTLEAASKLATKQGDIYSMGMTIYEVLTGKKPFHEYKGVSVVVPILDGERPRKPDFLASRGYTEELWELTTECWPADPAKRTTVSRLVETFREAALKWNPGTDGMDRQASA